MAVICIYYWMDWWRRRSNILPFPSLLTIEPYETLFNTGSSLYRLCCMVTRSSNRHHLSISTSCSGKSHSGIYSKGPNDQWSVINRWLTNVLICQSALVNHLLDTGTFLSFNCLVSDDRVTYLLSITFAWLLVCCLAWDSYQNGQFFPDLKIPKPKCVSGHSEKLRFQTSHPLANCRPQFQISFHRINRGQRLIFQGVLDFAKLSFSTFYDHKMARDL